MNFEELREAIATMLQETEETMLNDADTFVGEKAENYIRGVQENILHKNPSKKELVKEAYATGAIEAIAQCMEDLENLLEEMEEEENE